MAQPGGNEGRCLLVSLPTVDRTRRRHPPARCRGNRPAKSRHARQSGRGSRSRPQPAAWDRRRDGRHALPSRAGPCGSCAWPGPVRACRRDAGAQPLDHGPRIRVTRGERAVVTALTKPASVETSIGTPSWAKRWLWRCSGRCRPNLAIITSARRFGPARPRGSDGTGPEPARSSR